ncbi:MAG: cupin domain-containing protein [Methylocella sp.]
MNRCRSLPFLFAALVIVQPAKAADKAPSPKETVVLQRAAVPETDRELGLGIAEFPPNAAMPRKKAPGPEVCYVLEGEVIVQIEGERPRIFRAGETFRLPANTVHVTTAGPAGAKVIAAWVHAPGKQFNIVIPD